MQGPPFGWDGWGRTFGSTVDESVAPIQSPLVASGPMSVGTTLPAGSAVPCRHLSVESTVARMGPTPGTVRKSGTYSWSAPSRASSASQPRISASSASSRARLAASVRSQARGPRAPRAAPGPGPRRVRGGHAVAEREERGVDPVLDRGAMAHEVQPIAGTLALGTDGRVDQPDRGHEVAPARIASTRASISSVLAASGARPLTLAASAMSTSQPWPCSSSCTKRAVTRIGLPVPRSGPTPCSNMPWHAQHWRPRASAIRFG